MRNRFRPRIRRCFRRLRELILMNKKVLPLVFFLLLVVFVLAALKWRGGNPSRPILIPTPTIKSASPSARPTLEEGTPNPLTTGPVPTDSPESKITVGNFTITDNPVCFEKSKPVIYYFGSSSCPHCQWEHPIIKRVAEKFSGLIFFHDNMDTQNDLEVFSKYNEIHSGYIPFLVFGCKYVRLGSGEDVGEAIEEENLTALICKLTGSGPAEVCDPLKEKISEIK